MTEVSETTAPSKSLSQADLMSHKTEFEEKGRDDDNDDQRAFEKDDQLHSDGRQKTEIVEEFLCDANHGNGCEKVDTFEVQEWNSSQTDDPFWSLGCNEDDESVYIADMLLQNAEYIDSDRFICIELIDTAAIACEKPLTNSLEDVEEESLDKQGLSVEEANGVANRRLMEEHKTRDEDIEKFATPSMEIDNAEAAGVEETDIFPGTYTFLRIVYYNAI